MPVWFFAKSSPPQPDDPANPLLTEKQVAACKKSNTHIRNFFLHAAVAARRHPSNRQHAHGPGHASAGRPDGSQMCPIGASRP